jgi:murein DD-endopeptidase MepM/ murein hydrolase activator NlpD
VERGQQFGEVGNSGNARFTSPHVHFAAATDGNIDRGHAGGSGNLWFEKWIWGQ